MKKIITPRVREEPELLPCPVCGGTAELVETSRRYEFCPAVECRTCGTNTGPAKGSWAEKGHDKEVIEKWSRRAPILGSEPNINASTPNPDKLDDAVLAMLSVCIIDDEIGNRPGIQTQEGFDYTALVRLHKKGYLATCPHHPINAIWLTPEGARRARELFRQMFYE